MAMLVRVLLLAQRDSRTLLIKLACSRQSHAWHDYLYFNDEAALKRLPLVCVRVRERRDNLDHSAI